MGSAAAPAGKALGLWRVAAWSSALVALVMPVDRSGFLFVLAVVAALGCGACVASHRGRLGGRAAQLSAIGCLGLTVLLTTGMASLR
jgi:hypothetical protein